jgi:Zn-dependent peptidase ImmA (M78 family)/transcriptional regulator with XRE-family HTH domain
MAHEPGLTQKALALSIGMAPDALSRALNGERGFSIDELFALADRFRVSVHEIATGERDPYAVSVAARHGFDVESRSYKTPEWDTARPVLDGVALAYRQAGDLARTSGPRNITGMSASAVRADLVAANGPGFVRSFASAIERSFDVDVVRADGLSSGYSLRIGERVVVVTSDTSNWFYQNYSLAHELGHVASGTMLPIDEVHQSVGQHEAAANRFAAELLLPAELVRTVAWHRADRDTLGKFLWDTGVSTKSLGNRLKNLRIGCSEAVASALDEKTQRVISQSQIFDGVKSSELVAARAQESATRRFPPHLIAAHRERVENGEMHARTLAWMLGDDIAEVEREFELLRSDVTDDALREFLGHEG